MTDPIAATRNMPAVIISVMLQLINTAVGPSDPPIITIMLPHFFYIPIAVTICLCAILHPYRHICVYIFVV